MQNSDEAMPSIISAGRGILVKMLIQSKLFITSLVITEYSISDIKLLGTDLFPLKFPLSITEYSLNDTNSNFWEQIYNFY